MVEYEQQIAETVAARPERGIADGQRRRRHRVHAGRPELRPARGPPEAAQRSASSASKTSSRNCVPSSPPFAGMKVYLQNPPTIRIGGQVTKSLYQFSMQIAGQGRTLRRDREADQRNRKASRRGGRHQRRRDPAPRRSTSPSIATRPAPWASTPTRSRTRSTTRTARAGSPPSTARSTNTRCCWNWSRDTRPIRARFRCCTSRTPPAS